MAEMNKRSAARQIVACSLCRSRKVKCSGEIPCKNCVARGTECIVMEGKKRGPSVGLRKAKKGPKLDRTPQHFESVSPVQNDEQSTTSDGTLISAIESSLVENSQEQIFTHAFFRNVTLEDFDGNRLPFVDYYFKWANKLIPFFSKIWLESNFLDLPIYLLHSMFAMTLVTPYNKGKLGDEDRQSLFQKSFQFASKYLFELEDIDPFAVCGVIHLAGAALNVDQPNEVALLWSMAFNWAIRLELPLDVSPTWKTASNTDIRDINFCRSIWFFMYTYGHVGRIIYDMTFPETPDISAATIKDYITPNGEDATNISENTLSFYAEHIPLVSIGRKATKLLSQTEPVTQEQTNEMMNLLDAWYADLPMMYKVNNNDYIWMGRTLANLNMLYHHQRLVLLRFRFITAINDMIAANAAAEQLLGSKSNQILPITDQTIIECLNSASAITAINRAFIVSKPTGIEDKSTVHKMLVYHSALYHCCAAAATGDVFSMIPIVSIHVEAMKMIVRGPNFDKLQNCFADPAKAIRYLKGFVNCWVY